uniref:SBS2 n=1 Tax=Hordeum vulgare subsp. vulgare TaxID=112509 RepID=A0A4Y5RRY1_HORVV|nr:SBS2 [Hordeum vulgare subsp. vulgare]
MGSDRSVCQKLLLLVFATLALQHSTTTYGSGTSGGINRARPGCPDKCGNVSIPYPFGTGNGCFREPFSVTCNESRAYLASTGVRVLDINLTFGEVRVQNPKIASQCNYTNGTNSTSLAGLSLDPFHKVSNTKNKLISIGCSMLGMIVGVTKGKNQLELPIVNSCFSFCTDASSVDDSTECAGMGCCQTPLPGNISSFNTTSTPVPTVYNATIQSFSPCSYSFIAEVESFKFDRSYASSTNFRTKYTEGFPLVLDWVVGNGSCSEATRIGSQNACQAVNSECINVSNGPGYRCNCAQGYAGNPYLQGGCRDINECEHPNMPLYPCKGTSAGVVFLIVCVFALRAEYQKRKLAKEKERFFEQNGGQILYHQIMSKQVDTLKIFTQEDLKKATSGFDESREVGKGGHGTVYKGILKDSKEVAVKRSKIMNVAETDEFVHEIIILSQTNHRNVVRLLGCCLEVEVPMLVYEFIPNGTLFQFIHRNYGSPPPSLDTRLRVAQESAEALAYLHLSMNQPIVHGDVKSMNILLDENYMAKVTDFGASRMLPKDEVQFMTLVQGTMGYLDPEYMQERKLTEKSDVYSFGVVLLELIPGKTAIYHDGPKEAKNLASSFLLAMKDGSLDDILDASIVGDGMETLLGEVAEMASMCLSTRGKERPSMTQVADKLKALRSTWMEKLVLEHGKIDRLVAGSSPADLMLRVPPSSSVFSTGAQISEVGIETPR